MSEEDIEAQIQEACDKLEVMMSLEGTEVGEYWCGLAHLSVYTYMMSPEFKKVFAKEIQDQVQVLETQYELIEEDIVRTEKRRLLRPRM